MFGQVVVGHDRGDISEALLGAILFGVPMAVEGGTTEVGEQFVASPLAALGTVAVVYGIVYVAGIPDVRVTRRLLGVVPRRLVGILTVPLVAAAYLPMAVGAALGDILRGT